MGDGMVSVVIPVYNGERFLAGAIECVRGQDMPVEIIVVNDGSTDGTARIAAGFDVQYIEQKNAGPAAARNCGIQAARGEFVAFLDADDSWTPGALPLLYNRLQATHADIAHGCMQCVRMENDCEYPIGLPRRSTQVGSMLFRRSVFGRVGLFNETLRYSEDTDWCMRAADCGVSISIVDDVVLMYRIHALSTTFGRAADELSIVQVLRSAIERRQAENNNM